MDLLLAEQLLLLAYDDETGRLSGSSIILDCGLAAAVLIDLELARRISVTGQRVRLIDSTPVGDTELDAALELIVAEDKPRAPAWWIEKLRTGIRGRLLGRLSGKGTLSSHRRRALGIFPMRFESPKDPAMKSAIRGRLKQAVTEDTEPGEGTVALLALLDACGFARAALPDMDPSRLQDAIAKDIHGQWATDAVHAATRSIHGLLVASATGSSPGAIGTHSG